MHEYSTGQSITGFSFVQPGLDTSPQCRIPKPVQHKQCSFYTANLSQSFSQPILFVSVQQEPY
ncbi:Uncharacterised protein [Shigella sonnei]|nr:Uncharacterised protein [Shigella sonnei]